MCRSMDPRCPNRSASPWCPSRRAAAPARRSQRRAAQALADAGYVVEELCPPRYEDAVTCYVRLIISDLASVLGQLSQRMGPDAMAFVNNCFQAVPPLTDATAWSQLMVERDGIVRAWSTFMAERPLLLTPTWTQLPFEHGFDSATPAGTAATIELMRPVVRPTCLGCLRHACRPDVTRRRDCQSGCWSQADGCVKTCVLMQPRPLRLAWAWLRRLIRCADRPVSADP